MLHYYYMAPSIIRETIQLPACPVIVPQFILISDKFSCGLYIRKAIIQRCLGSAVSQIKYTKNLLGLIL